MTSRWPVLAGGLVAEVGDALQAPVLDLLGDLLGQGVGVDLVGQLGDNEAGAVLDLGDLDDRAHRDQATPGAVGVLDSLAPQDQRTRREVRPGDPRHDFGQLLLAGRVRVGEHPLGRLRDLAQVVRRDLGRHTDRDASGAVDQEVREAGRQHRRLGLLAVVVGPEVDGVLVDVAHHLDREGREPALRISRRRGRVVAGAAEVALSRHERIAHRPVLHEPHEGVVDRRVTVRVVLAHDIADDATALVEAAVRAVATVPHRVDDPPVHRLEPIAHVRQRPRDDDRHRVLDVAALHLDVQVDRLDRVGALGRQFSH